MLTRDHTVLPATHTFYPQVKWSIPVFDPQPHSVAALWLVLISHPTEGRRLSWPGWLGEILMWFACRKMVTNPSICRGGRELNLQPSSHESNALTTGLPSHHYYTPLTGSDARPIELCHFWRPWVNIKVIHQLQNFSNKIFHTVSQQLTRFQQT